MISEPSPCTEPSGRMLVLVLLGIATGGFCALGAVLLGLGFWVAALALPLCGSAALLLGAAWLSRRD